MKIETTTKTIELFGKHYRYTFHPSPIANLLQIEVSVGYENCMGKVRFKWETIYYGHGNPMEEAVKFYNEQLTKTPAAI